MNKIKWKYATHRRTLNQFLGLFQSCPGDASHFLDHLDLGLGIESSQLDLEDGLLLHDCLLGSLSSPFTLSIHHATVVVGEAKAFPHALDELGDLEHVQAYNLVGEVVDVWRGEDFIFFSLNLEGGEGDYGHLLAGGEVLGQHLSRGRK